MLSKEAKFWLWNAKGIFLNECFIVMQLAIEVPDTETKPVHPGRFFVRRPILEPRRPQTPLLEPRRSQSPVFEQKRQKSLILEPRRLQNDVMEGRNIVGVSGIQNGLGKLNGSEIQRKHGKQNHQMTQSGFPSLPNVYDTSGWEVKRRRSFYSGLGTRL